MYFQLKNCPLNVLPIPCIRYFAVKFVTYSIAHGWVPPVSIHVMYRFVCITVYEPDECSKYLSAFGHHVSHKANCYN